MNIRFKSETKGGFYDTLRTRVDAYFDTRQLAKRGLPSIYLKASLILLD